MVESRAADDQRLVSVVTRVGRRLPAGEAKRCLAPDALTRDVAAARVGPARDQCPADGGEGDRGGNRGDAVPQGQAGDAG
jgi:hypothetical protein